MATTITNFLRGATIILYGLWLAGAAVHARPSRQDEGEGFLQARAKTTILLGGGVELRTMALGASITNGDGSSDKNGYRKYLRDLLLADGNKVDYVGSRQGDGNMTDNEVEGWGGFRIDEIFEKAKASVPKYLPNLVLINAGTNDCIQKYESDTAHERMLDMIKFIWSSSTRVSVILSTLLPNAAAETEKCVVAVNEKLRTLVKEQQAISKKIVLVDFHASDGIQLDQLADGIHPNDEGYEKMANMWFAGVQDASSRGWLESPVIVEPAEGGVSSRADPASTANAASTSTPKSTQGPSVPTAEPVAEAADKGSDKGTGSGLAVPWMLALAITGTIVTLTH